MLEINHLSKKFGKKEVLRDISYSFEGGVYGLLGPNGAGKTTLIRCILELYPYKGEIIFHKQNVMGQKTDREKPTIGYLPQKSGVFPGLTVEEQLYYFANLKNMEKDEIKDDVDRVLEVVNMEEYRNRKGKNLSGGMVRRLGIAQALMNKPDMIIFDEPTTGLDPEERMRFKNVIKKLRKETTVLMSTHIVEDVEAVCDRILIMKEGRFVAAGTQEEISSLAEEKVYEVVKEQVETKDYIEKEKEIDGKELFRILSKRKLEQKAEKPTVEDGYLCVLKDI